VLAKHLMRDAGLPTPDFYAFSEAAFRELGAADALPAIEDRLEFPIVVKPARGGSSMRLNFSYVSDEDIREGVRRLGAIVHEQVALYGTLTGTVVPSSPVADERPAQPSPAGPDGGLADVLHLPRRAGEDRRAGSSE
jgi:hypothetical protein